MNYLKKNNTYFATPKDDWKDRIELEVGDSKQDDFYPQIKVMRWDNEVNCSIRLKHDEKAPSVSKVGDKIKWQGDKIEAEIYALEEGHEFEIILKEKPKTNVIEFSLETKGLDFFYQPELTQKEKDQGAERPDNIVGSYAVYTSENKANYVGGKEYKCGKIGHIYRPQVEDANGTKVWGELNIQGNKLTVTIPQEFLDKAVYPIRHAAGLTFGYETIGASTNYFTTSEATGSLFTAPLDITSATVSNITIAGYYNTTATYIKGLIWKHSDLTLVTNAVGNAVGLPVTTVGWVASVFSSAPSLLNSTDYILGFVQSNTAGRLNYDTGESNQSHYDSSNNYTTPQDMGSAGHYTNKYSIYVTYTAAGSTSPSASPSSSPSASPSVSPSVSPSASPSQSPSASPSSMQINLQTDYWKVTFGEIASASPSLSPSLSPSASPSISPSISPSESPSSSPSQSPSASVSPSVSPSQSPSVSPSKSPSASPSVSPSASPSQSPSTSESPSESPSVSPSQSPSASVSPSKSPSSSPSQSPSASESPSQSPSQSPSVSPSGSPSQSPSMSPSESPSQSPSTSVSPSSSPSESSSSSPSASPSASLSPSASPSASPSSSESPSASPSSAPTNFDLIYIVNRRKFAKWIDNNWYWEL